MFDELHVLPVLVVEAVACYLHHVEIFVDGLALEIYLMAVEELIDGIAVGSELVRGKVGRSGKLEQNQMGQFLFPEFAVVLLLAE